MTPGSFERMAALCAMVNAMTGFLYALAFTAVSPAAPGAERFWAQCF